MTAASPAGPFPSPPPLPIGLAPPRDDGAAAHLRGIALPGLGLPSTAGGKVVLAELDRPTVLFVYPRMGRPGESPSPEWDLVPGARGCTNEACGFRDRAGEIAAAGSAGTAVLGLSSQSTAEQSEAVVRLALTYALVSDARFDLARLIGLPTFTFEGQRYYRRLTLIVSDGRVEHVFYPVFPPDRHAAEVLAWLGGRSARNAP
jgi:peroxiredoxin